MRPTEQRASPSHLRTSWYITYTISFYAFSVNAARSTEEAPVSVTVDPLFDPEVVEDPHEYYAELRSRWIRCTSWREPGRSWSRAWTDPRGRRQAGRVLQRQRRSSCITAPTTARRPSRAPARPARTATRWRSGAVLATADPPDHTRQRKVVTRRLSTTAMQAMEPEFRELVDLTLDARCRPDASSG